LKDLLNDTYGPIEIQAEGCLQYIIAFEKERPGKTNNLTESPNDSVNAIEEIPDKFSEIFP
jgi:hypothetical protein